MEHAFNFFEDGVVQVQVIDDKIYFKKINTSQKKNQKNLNSIYSMELSLTPGELKSASFCAYLASKDDSV